MMTTLDKEPHRASGWQWGGKECASAGKVGRQRNLKAVPARHPDEHLGVSHLHPPQWGNCRPLGLPLPGARFPQVTHCHPVCFPGLREQLCQATLS